MPQVDLYADAPRLPEGAVDPRLLVGAGDRPVEIDIGSGRGWFIVDRLERVPEARMIGLEVKRKWAFIVDERLKKRGLGDRGRVFAEDAREAIARFPDGCLSLAAVHFPDPWWKKRHRKRLLMTEQLCAELARVVVAGGELFVQTDVEERARLYEALIAREPGFEPHARIARVPENPYGTSSPRERRAVADGLPVIRLRFRRK